MSGPFIDVADAKDPSRASFESVLLRKYLEGTTQDPRMFFTNRPVYRAIVGNSRFGTDFTDIQRAIDKVNALGGGSILLRAGTYIVRSDLTLYSNIRLVGEDPYTTFLDFNSDNKIINIVGEDSTTNLIKNVGLFGLTLTNRRAILTVGDDTAIYMNNAENILIENCIFTDNWNVDRGYDIFGNDSCALVRVLNNKFISSGNGVGITGNDWKIDNNYFYDAKGYCLTGSANRINIINNAFDSCNQNIFYIGNSNYIDIIGNNIANHLSTRGITSEAGNTTDYVTISGNVIAGGSDSGDAIYVGSASHRWAITGNIIRGWGGDGVETHNTSYGVTVTGNAITNNTGYGVRTGTGGGVVATSNILTSNTAGSHSSGGADIFDHNIV